MYGKLYPVHQHQIDGNTPYIVLAFPKPSFQPTSYMYHAFKSTLDILSYDYDIVTGEYIGMKPDGYTLIYHIDVPDADKAKAKVVESVDALHTAFHIGGWRFLHPGDESIIDKFVDRKWSPGPHRERAREEVKALLA